MKAAAVFLTLTVVLCAGTLGAMAQTNEPLIPGIASFVLPGLGQLLNDEMDKAILHFGVMVAINVATYYTSSFFFHGAFRYAFVGLLHLGWAVYSGWDAYTVAQEKGFRFGLVPNGIAFETRF